MKFLKVQFFKQFFCSNTSIECLCLLNNTIFLFLLCKFLNPKRIYSRAFPVRYILFEHTLYIPLRKETVPFIAYPLKIEYLPPFFQTISYPLLKHSSSPTIVSNTHHINLPFLFSIIYLLQSFTFTSTTEAPFEDFWCFHFLLSLFLFCQKLLYV